jgi:guanylate kinase
MTKGRLIVVSGPSGSGKTTICDRLERDYGCEYVVTATTRSPRTGERNGVDYHFYSREAFEALVQKNAFLEHALVHNNYYGTPRESVETALARGATLILEIDTQGASQIRRNGIEHASLFIDVPDMETLQKRLRQRNTDSDTTIESRMKRAAEELREKGNYNFVVVNDDLDRAVAEAASRLGLTRH